MLKVLFLGGRDQGQLGKLRQQYPGVTFAGAATEEDELREIVDADAAIGWPTSAHILAGRKLQWIHAGSAGIDWISQVPELVQSDIVLTNGRGSYGNAIADHAFAMILAFTRQLRAFTADQQAKVWSGRNHAANMLELSDATLGIVGLGNIGGEIARRGAGFRMKVVAVDLNPAAQAPGAEQVWGLDRLDDLMQISDYLAVSVPRTPQTIGLIDARRLALMQPTAHLIVVSRGRIVEEEALIAALQAGRLAGAGLDVTATEPLPTDSPLWDLPNVILTPHISGASVQTRERGQKLLHENLRRFIAGEDLLNICDKEAGF